MATTATRNIVTEFPWETDPLNPETKEQHAYTSGMLINRLRRFFNDDEQTELINWGAGPIKESTDLSKMEFKGHVGSFGIFVALEPADLDLYRALLPENFSMPEQPIVSLVNLDYNQPNPIVRYKEGMVMLNAVAANGTQTWYVHSMPVEDWLMLAMGHDWGFRKQLFDMTVTKEKTTVMQKDGSLYMSLELTGEPWTNEADAVIPERGIGGVDDMSVVYPRNPELVLRFHSHGQVRALDETKGMVKITVGSGVDWAGLVPEDAVAPGLYQRYVRGMGNGGIQKIK